MSSAFLLGTVQERPERTLGVYRSVEGALQEILLKHGDRYHDRYRAAQNIGSIALALVIGPNVVDTNYYNPLSADAARTFFELNPEADDTTPEASPSGESFHVTNRLLRPEAWKRDTGLEERILGKAASEDFIMFSAFALAKLHLLSSLPREKSSHLVDFSPSAFGDNRKLPFGKFGNAGGVRLDADTRIAASGLWEVHDHAVVKVVAKLIRMISRNDENGELPPIPDSDKVAGWLESVFGGIKLLHPEKDAKDLGRQEVHQMLMPADDIVKRTKFEIAA